MEFITEERLRVLMTDLHGKIVQASIDAVEKIATGAPGVVYPPNGSITGQELAALRALRVGEVQKRAMTKVVADAIASVAFHWFCVVDAVASPDCDHSEPWLPLMLADHPDEEYVPLLHDEFMGAWWAYTDRSDVV